MVDPMKTNFNKKSLVSVEQAMRDISDLFPSSWRPIDDLFPTAWPFQPEEEQTGWPGKWAFYMAPGFFNS